jgi:hypothetical protein
VPKYACGRITQGVEHALHGIGILGGTLCCIDLRNGVNKGFIPVNVVAIREVRMEVLDGPPQLAEGEEPVNSS